MRGWATIAIGALAVATAAVACGSSDTGPGGNTPGGACADLANQGCAKLEQCLGAFFKAAFGDTTTCAAHAEKSCTLSLAAPGTSLTSEQVESCSQAYASLSCDLQNVPDACKPQPGSLADGTACGSDNQCQSTYCQKSGSASCGTCAARVAAGGSCASGSACAIGTVCSPKLVCVAPASAGQSCTDVPCESDLVCLSGTCQPPLGAGAACDPTTAPLAGGCDLTQALYCDPTKKTCVQAQFATAGQPCGLISGAYVLCTGGADCKMSSSTGMGTCIAPIAEGAACGGTIEGSCEALTQCINGTCQVPDPSTCK